MPNPNQLEEAVVIRVNVDGTVQITKLGAEMDALKAKAQSTANGTAPLATALGSIKTSGDPVIALLQNMRGELADLSKANQQTGADLAVARTGIQQLSSVLGVVGPLAIGAAVGIGAMRVILGPLAEAAGRAAESQQRLQDAVKRSGSTITDEAGRISQAVKQISESTPFDETELRNAATLFVTITGNAQAAEQAIRPIADLSAALGIGLEESSKMIARAGEGMVGGLGRAGIVFSDLEQKQLATASSGDRLAMIFAKIEEKTGGAAAAQLGTYAGQVKEIGKAWDDLKATLGNLGALEVAIGFFAGLKLILDKVTDSFKSAAEKAKELEEAGEFAATKGKVNPYYNTFNIPGPSPDAVNESVAKANDLAAALAKVNEQAVATRQSIQTLFTKVADMQLDIGVAFKAPSTDPVEQAVNKVEELARQKLKAVASLTTDVENEIATGLAKVEALRAQITSERTSGKGDADQITQQQRLIALTLQQVTADRQALQVLGQMPATINASADAAAELARKNVLKEMADKAKASYEALIATIEKAVQAAKDQFMNERDPAVRAGANDVVNQLAEQYKATAALIETERAAGMSAKEAAALQTAASEKFNHGVLVLKDVVRDLVSFAGIMDKLTITMGQNFKEGLADGITDFATTGGKNFGQIAGQMFVKNVQAGAHALTDMFQQIVVSAFGGNLKPGTKDPTTGLEYSPDQLQQINTNAANQGQAIMGAIGGFAGMVGNALNVINTKQQQLINVAMSAGQGLLSGAITGASLGSVVPGIGTAIGAVVGAIVGALIGGITAAIANKKTMDSMSYAVYGYKDGQSYVEAQPGLEKQFNNIGAKELTDMYRQLDSVRDDYVNKFVALLSKFPKSIRDGLDLSMTGLDLTPTMDKWDKLKRSWLMRIVDPLGISPFEPLTTNARDAYGNRVSGRGIGNWLYGQYNISGHEYASERGDIRDPTAGGKDNQFQALKAFPSDFQNFIANVVPKDVMEHYKPQVEKGFEAMGMTATQFGVIWDELSKLDPDKAMAALGNLIDAIAGISDSLLYGQNVGTEFAAAMANGTNLTSQGFAIPQGMSDFGVQLLDLGNTIADSEDAIADAVGIEAIATAGKALADNLAKAKDALNTFLNSVLQTARDLHQFLSDKLFQSSLDAAKTPQDKSNVLLDRYNQDLAKIKAATALGLSPQQVDQYARDAAGLLDQMLALDPANRRAWYDAQLAKLDQISQASLDALAKQAIDQYNAIIATAQGAMDYLNGKMVDTAGPAIDSLSNSADAAAEALNNLAVTAGGKSVDKGEGSYYDSADYHRRHDQPETPTTPTTPPGTTIDFTNLPGANGRLPYDGSRTGGDNSGYYTGGRGGSLPGSGDNAPPVVGGSDTGSSDFAATSTHAGFQNGKFTYLKGTDADLHSYLIENALSYMHDGASVYDSGAYKANDRSTQAKAMDRIVVLVERMTQAIEKGEHIDNQVTISLARDADTAASRPAGSSQFVRDVATRRVIRGV